MNIKIYTDEDYRENVMKNTENLNNEGGNK
jgi:hypothetical protein